LDSAIAQSEVWSQRNAQQIAESKRKKNNLIFWLIFGLSPNVRLSESLSEGLIQTVKSPNVLLCSEEGKFP